MIVLDISDPEAPAQLEVTERLLEELGAAGKPILYVFNKCDRGASFPASVGSPAANPYTVSVSARTGQGMELLVQRLEELLHADKKEVIFEIPNAQAGQLNLLYQNATVKDVDYGAEKMTVCAIVDRKTHGMLRRFDPNWVDPQED